MDVKIVLVNEEVKYGIERLIREVKNREGRKKVKGR